MNIYIHVHRYIWQNIFKKHHQKKLDPYIFFKNRRPPGENTKKAPATCRKAAKALPAPQSCTTPVSWFATARSSPPQSLSLSRHTRAIQDGLGGGGIPHPFYHTKKGQSIFEGMNHPVNLVGWSKNRRKSLFFKSWFLGESFVLQFHKLSFVKHRWLPYLHILHSKKKQNFC